LNWKAGWLNCPAGVTKNSTIETTGTCLNHLARVDMIDPEPSRTAVSITRQINLVIAARSGKMTSPKQIRCGDIPNTIVPNR
jgi:hypothetical protein